MERVDYLAFRRQYQPANLALVIIAESPPISGKYFYNPEGAVTEPLFRAIFQQIGLLPSSKQSGLRRLQELGWLLIDATYEPVNDYTDKNKNLVIARDYPHLREDLMTVSPNQTTPVVLIKANVCRLLEERLRADGFKVINHGQIVPFPSHGQQGKFHFKFSELLQKAGFSRGEQPPI
jgi:hypothetical protein